MLNYITNFNILRSCIYEIRSTLLYTEDRGQYRFAPLCRGYCIRAGRELIYKVYFTNFSKEISGWYHDMSTDEIVIFHCCEHYVNRFNERYLRRCKRDDIGRIRIFAKRIAKAQLVDQSIAVDPSKRLINIIKIKAKGEYRHLHFITCYQSKEKVKKLLS